jgi:hypothetical protein
MDFSSSGAAANRWAILLYKAPSLKCEKNILSNSVVKNESLEKASFCRFLVK